MDTESAQTELIAFLKTSQIFAGMDEEILSTCLPIISEKRLAQDERLIRQGDFAKTIYIIRQGKLRVTHTDVNGKDLDVAIFYNGESVGEVAFLTGERRTAHVYAQEPTTLVILNRKDFDQFAKHSPEIAQTILQAIVERLQRTQLQDMLYTNDWFSHLDESSKNSLLQELELILLPKGEVVMEEGTTGHSLYIIVSGRLAAKTSQPNVFGQNLQFGVGETVGELGLLTGNKRSATVYSIRDTLLAKLPEESFFRLLVKHPQSILRQFVGNAIVNLSEKTLAELQEQRSFATLAVVPIGNDVPLSVFTQRLTQALFTHGNSLYLNAERLDSFLGTDGIAQTPEKHPNNSNIARWLNRQETIQRFVIYETDATYTEWTKRCLRQADQLVFVSNAGNLPAPSQLSMAKQLIEQNPSLTCSLVLLHDNYERPTAGTKNWLDQLSVRSHFHVHLDKPNHCSRLARQLIGKGVGVVMSGGGARGAAYIGAIRAFREVGIAVDHVGGASGGAIISAMTALEWDTEMMIQKILATDRNPEYTFPSIAFVTGKKYRNALQQTYDDLQIEDLWLNYFAVSADITKAKVHEHNQGSLWRAVRASTSVPGFLPPVLENNSLLVDGGIMDNLPVDIMREKEDVGPIIALDVSDPATLTTSLPLEDGIVSGWQVLWQRLNPLIPNPEAPSIRRTLLQMITLYNIQLAQLVKDRADYYIRFPVGHYGLLDFGSSREMAEIGYRVTMEKLEEWDKVGDLAYCKNT